MTATRPLVSIVTPTLNQGRYIEATIRSIRAQAYTEYEHIVVDGGSTDDTLAILRSHESRYPLRWLSERDGGMYEAINKGLKRARGDILCYLNSDDLYFPWTLQRVVAAFVKHPETDFVFGDALSVNEVSGHVAPYWTPPFDLVYLRTLGFLAQPTVFWRRKAFECEGPFDTSLRYVADCEYWMRAGAHHAFTKINEFLAVERDHPGAQRFAHGSRVWEELASLRTRYAEQGHPRVMHWLRRAAWNRWYSLALALAERTGRTRGAWSSLLAARALPLRPWSVLLLQVPWIGPRVAGQAYGPVPPWVMQASPDRDTAGRLKSVDRDEG